MADLIIKNLTEDIEARLRIEAVLHGHSVEEEVKLILRQALAMKSTAGFGRRIHQRFLLSGGVDLDIPKRPSTV